MSKIILPKGYQPALNEYETQCAIEFIKQTFQRELCSALNLKRVSAPLFVRGETGLNDNLSGTERPVGFDIPDTNCNAEVVHSLAKWKRLALKKYNFSVGEGLYTDMNAIRRDEIVDNLHSVYVDQWDWEKIITQETRNLSYLHSTVEGIVHSICYTSEQLKVRYPQLKTSLCRDVTFVTSQELEDLYPNLTPEQREYEFSKIHKTIFIEKIGGKLKSGIKHGDRAPDYDDWEMNGDIIFWNDVLQCAFEVSSMGIRVNKESLLKQLEISQCQEREKLPFHQMLLNDQLPLTIGGGIGQSRICMLLLGCAHIGEVQVSIWDKETMDACTSAGIPLL